MKILTAVLKFTLDMAFAALAGGANNSTNDNNSPRAPKPSDLVVDKNGDIKFRNDRVEYY